MRAGDHGSPSCWPMLGQRGPAVQASTPSGRPAAGCAHSDKRPVSGLCFPRENSSLQSLRPPRLAGSTFRFTWTAGPEVSAAQVYLFHTDGTVSYAIIEPHQRPQYFTPSRYGAFEVAPDIFIVACLDASGYALTVTMNFRNKHLQGFATDAAQWYPVQGHFEELSQY